MEIQYMRRVPEILPFSSVFDQLYEQVSSVFLTVLVLFLAVVFLIKGLSFITAWTSKRSIVVTVNHKERVFYPLFAQSMYLVYTDKGVFRKQDSWAFLNFRSSTTYGQVKVNTRYEFIIYGLRIPIFSRYPNIIKVKELCDLEP